MNGSDSELMTCPRSHRRPASRRGRRSARPFPSRRFRSLERQVDHRRGVKRQQLAQQQAADDRDAQREAQFATRCRCSIASGSAPNNAASVVIMIGRKRRSQACTIASVGNMPLVPLRLEREIDHHDRVLLDDAHQQHDADQRDERQILPEQHQRQRARRRRPKGSVERIVIGMDEALVEHAEHDVDRHHRRQNAARARRQASL